MLAVTNPMLFGLLAVLCCLAGFDLWRQYSVGTESYWFYQYSLAVQKNADFWTFGFRTERLQERNKYLAAFLNEAETRIKKDTYSLRSSPTQHTNLNNLISLGTLLYNDSNLFHIRCGDSYGLLRIGVSDFRADPRDSCQLFTGSLSTIPGPETTFEKVYLEDGSFALRTMSNDQYLQAVPPPLDNTALPWKLVSASPVIGAAEKFRETNDGYIYSALMGNIDIILLSILYLIGITIILIGGLLQCANDQMVKGFPGPYYSTPSVFQFQSIRPELAMEYRQQISLSRQILALQSSTLRDARAAMARYTRWFRDLL
jgi:hypothetical protein